MSNTEVGDKLILRRLRTVQGNFSFNNNSLQAGRSNQPLNCIVFNTVWLFSFKGTFSSQIKTSYSSISVLKACK